MGNAERLIEALATAFPDGEADVDEEVVERMVAAVAPLAAPEVTGMMSGGGGTFEAEYQGLDGLREAWSDWLSTWKRIRFEIEGIEEIGEHVVTFGRQVGTARHGVDIEQPSAAVWKFADGKLVRVEFHLDRDAARASARGPD